MRFNPILWLLQEVDRFTDRSGKILIEAQRLAELTRMSYRFYKALDRSNGEYGVCYFNKFEIEESKDLFYL